MIKKVNLLLLFVIAPVSGFYIAFYQTGIVNKVEFQTIKYKTAIASSQFNSWHQSIDNIQEKVAATQKSLDHIQTETKEEIKAYKQQKQQIAAASNISSSRTQKSNDVLEQVLSNLLGDPIGVTKGDNATIKVYTLKEAGYRGYMAKVNVHDPDALQMVLANDQVINSVGETTSHAARRLNATLAVNAGGFLRRNGNKIPLGVTVVDGQLKTSYFDHNYPFVGFDTNGNFTILKDVDSKKEIKQHNILHGASFRPILLKDGEKVAIPDRLQHQREPRTIIGSYSNGDLLFVVIDGRRRGWSNGITLEEAQEKLLSFKVKNAYNLDGGGSSTFYYKGKVLNKPSGGYQRPVTTNLLIFP